MSAVNWRRDAEDAIHDGSAERPRLYELLNDALYALEKAEAMIAEAWDEGHNAGWHNSQERKRNRRNPYKPTASMWRPDVGHWEEVGSVSDPPDRESGPNYGNPTPDWEKIALLEQALQAAEAKISALDDENLRLREQAGDMAEQIIALGGEQSVMTHGPSPLITQDRYAELSRRAELTAELDLLDDAWASCFRDAWRLYQVSKRDVMAALPDQCENYTRGDCREHGRDIDSPYIAEGYCTRCLVVAALAGEQP